MKLKKKWPLIWLIVYGLVLSGYAGFVLLDAFVIPKNVVSMNNIQKFEYKNVNRVTSEPFLTSEPQTEAPIVASNPPTEAPTVSPEPQTEAPVVTPEPPTEAPVVTPEPQTEVPVINPEPTDSLSYYCDEFSIEITKDRRYDINFYIADVRLSSIEYLKSGLADGVFGENVTDTTSSIAGQCNAVFAVNGDYYGFRDAGYVMRNGYLYRNTIRDYILVDDYVIYYDGNSNTIDEYDITAEALGENGAYQIFCFGPGLIQDSVVVAADKSLDEHANNCCPRTAIGMIEPLHYVFVVCDGRQTESPGVTLTQLGEYMQTLGCTQAYNLDGGGSTAMYFNGKIINKPTTNGKIIKERKISDIVYIGK